MRFLLTSLCLVLVGCAPYPKKNGFSDLAPVQKEIRNPYFSDMAKDYIYKATVTAFDKSFGGILVVKKLGREHHRIVFTTRMGNTLFDFSLIGETFEVNRIVREMNRKILVNVLKRDFVALTKESLRIEKTYGNGNESLVQVDLLSNKHYYTFVEGKLLKITRVRKGKEKVGFLFSGINDNIAKHIEIVHKNMALRIVLNAI